MGRSNYDYFNWKIQVLWNIQYLWDECVFYQIEFNSTNKIIGYFIFAFYFEILLDLNFFLGLLTLIFWCWANEKFQLYLFRIWGFSVVFVSMNFWFICKGVFTWILNQKARQLFCSNEFSHWILCICRLYFTSCSVTPIRFIRDLVLLTWKRRIEILIPQILLCPNETRKFSFECFLEKIFAIPLWPWSVIKFT